MNKIPTHPAAKLFPALPEGELKELSKNISAHGQRDPVIVFVGADGSRSLLDGRNRVAACKLAGVEPSVREVSIKDIGDPVEYVLGKNIHRRHLTKQQRAMAVAMLSPDKGRGQTPTNLEFAAEYLRQARTVLQHSAEAACQVLADDLPLGIAYRAASGEQLPSEFIEPPSSQPAQSGIPDTKVHAPRTGRGSRPPMAPDERKRKGATADDSTEFKKIIAALGMLASIRMDPCLLVKYHGDPGKWRYLRKAWQLISGLVDSGHTEAESTPKGVLEKALSMIRECPLTPFEAVEEWGDPSTWKGFEEALQWLKDAAER